MKTVERLFGISLAVISVTSLITAVTGLIGLALPLWALRLIGVVNLLSLPMLIYSTVMSMREKAESAKKMAKTLGAKESKAEPSADTPKKTPEKVRVKPHPKQLAAKRAAAGNKPKKSKKKR